MVKKRSKYGVDITAKGKKDRTYNGVQYDSKLEMQFYKEFIAPKVASGEITKFKRQVTYVLQDGFTMKDGTKILPIRYKSDFDIWYKDGTFIVYDVKGRADSVSLLKRKMFRNKYRDIPLIFICRNLKRGGWIPYDDLQKMRRADKKKGKK